MNIGLVPNRVESARANYRWLQAALAAFTPITLPAGDIYLDAADDGPLVTPATVSCGRIDATTGGGYSIDPTPQQGRIGTRLLWRSGGAFLRVRGGGIRADWVGGTVIRNYRDHVAMLTRHDDELRESAKELGLQRSHRELVAKGPIGESLVLEIEELRAADNLLHRRISRRQRELTELKDAVIEMRTDIKWMRQRWEERDNDATTH